jgi:mannosylglycerate hydrolase
VLSKVDMSSVQQSPRHVAVVVQTHWDREWYYPHQTFVARLLAVMSRVADQLEQGVLTSFLFDGQTAAYEDLLANAEPAMVRRIQLLVREGRIVLGPWYIMADEFLVSGESLIRNLEIGIADATTAGNCQRVGYLPDTFGHVGQMPQILRNFGIDSAVMWRGVDSPVAEFEWKAPNGDSVGGVFLTQGYYQHPLNVADWKTALNNYLALIAPRSQAHELLLTQGGDHLQSHSNIAARMAEYNATQSQYKLVQSTLAAHVDAVLSETAGKRATIAGELRNNAQAFVLPDVLSTRRYLKRLNQEAEYRMSHIVEPLFVCLLANGDTAAYPAKYIEDTWRLIIQQQAHDSICGCSVDEVHREMETRYVQIGQRLDALMAMAARIGGFIADEQHGGGDPFADDQKFSLFNPLLATVRGWVPVSLFLRGELAHSLTITDIGGNVIASEVQSATPDAIFYSPTDDFPDKLAGHRYEVVMQCELAALTTTSFEVTAQTTTTVSADSLDNTRSIENQYLSVQLGADGQLRITQKENGQTLSPLLSVLSELDAGDCYNFSPPPVQSITHASHWQLVSQRTCKAMQEMNLTLSMELPAGLEGGRKQASAQSVINTAELRLRLYADCAHLDAKLVWVNRARDQRTRLLLPMDTEVSHTHGDSAFDWVSRPVVHAQYPATPSRQEMTPAVFPTLSAIQAGNLLFCHQAMQEAEVVTYQGRTWLGLTMVRSVGWMSRRDLVTRGVGAGPDMETLDAQCLRTETFSFQVCFTDAATHPLAQAAACKHRPVLLRGHAHEAMQPINVSNTLMQLSSLRMVGVNVEMRLWNPTDAAVDFTIEGGQGWRVVRADGAPVLAENSRKANAFVVQPRQIITLRSGGQ